MSPTGNSLVLVWIFANAVTAGQAVDPTLSGGGMTAWTKVDSVSWNTAGTPSSNVTLYRALQASPGSGALTVTYANTMARCIAIPVEYSGVDTGGTNGSAAIAQHTANGNDGTGSSYSLTFASVTAGNATAGAFAAAGTATAGTGYTIAGNAVQESRRFTHEWRADAQTTIDMSWSVSVVRGGVAVEIAAATGAPTYTLTAAQGSYSVTGQAVTLLASRLLTASQGTYSVTGQATGLLAARLLTAASGTYLVSGRDATLTYSGASTAIDGLSIGATATGLRHRRSAASTRG